MSAQVQLPSDGMVAFARYVGIKGIERIKRYQFGSRYSDSTVGGQPRAVGEVNYDLISPSRTMVSEAEAIEGELEACLIRLFVINFIADLSNSRR